MKNLRREDGRLVFSLPSRRLEVDKVARQPYLNFLFFRCFPLLQAFLYPVAANYAFLGGSVGNAQGALLASFIFRLKVI